MAVAVAPAEAHSLVTVFPPAAQVVVAAALVFPLLELVSEVAVEAARRVAAGLRTLQRGSNHLAAVLGVVVTEFAAVRTRCRSRRAVLFAAPGRR